MKPPVENSPLGRHEWVASRLPEALGQAPSNLVADVGAGDGAMRAKVLAAGGRYAAYDLAPSSPGIERWDLDEPAAAADRPGVVILMEVIEHLGNPWRGVGHVADFLLPGGLLILTTPNPLWSRSRVMALWQGEPACFTQDDLDSNHHVWVAYPHIVERLLSDCGFDVLRYDTLDGRTPWPGPPVGLRYPLRLGLAAVLKGLERRDPRACGMAYGLVARKRGG